jgi:hypothetical protein
MTCISCPWVKTNTARDIPNFRMELAEDLSRCQSGELGAPIFACHLSRPGAEIPCAGWVAAHGRESIAIRLMVLQGKLPLEALSPQPELHASYDEVMEKLRS